MVTAVDSSGNGNDGTYAFVVGNPWHAGLLPGNSACHFAAFGADFVADVATPPGLVDFSTSWTIACLWANPTGSNNAAYYATGSGPYLEFDLFDGGARLIITTGFLTWQSVIGAVPADGLAHLVAFTFDKSPGVGFLDTGTFYVDGVAVANDTEPIFAVPASVYTQAGINGAGGSSVGEGVLDEWACWHRALSAGEVASLQAARGSFAAYNSAVLGLSPAAYYHLDEFLPAGSGPGGYLGLVAGPDP